MNKTITNKLIDCVLDGQTVQNAINELILVVPSMKVVKKKGGKGAKQNGRFYYTGTMPLKNISAMKMSPEQ